MKSTLDYLQTRRSVPAVNMVQPGPNADQLETMLTIATRVPDHGKLTPWRFIVYQGEGAERASALLFDIYKSRSPSSVASILKTESTRLTRSPVVVGVVSTAAPHAKIPKWEQELSAGASCMLLIAAANSMGFAAQWLTEWYCYDEEASRAIGLKDGERFAGFIHIGSADTVPSERPRPELSDLVVHF